MQRLVVGDRRRHQWRLSGDGQAVVEQLLAHVDVAAAKPQAASDREATAFRAAWRRPWCCLAAMTCLSGCTRAYYRKQADAEVNCIIDHKSEAVGCRAGRVPHRRRSALADVRSGRSRLSADAAGRSDLAPADELRRLQAGRALLEARAAHALRRQSELGGIPAAERRGAGRARHAGCGADGAVAVDRLPGAARDACTCRAST